MNEPVDWDLSRDIEKQLRGDVSTLKQPNEMSDSRKSDRIEENE